MKYEPRIREGLIKTITSDLFEKRRKDIIPIAYEASKEACPLAMSLIRDIANTHGFKEIDVFATWYEECWDGTQGCTDFIIDGTMYHTNDCDSWDVCCPLEIGGHFLLLSGGRPSVALSKYGLVFTGNQTDSTDTKVGIPRCVLFAEAVLTARSIKEAVRTLLNKKRASSYHHLIADVQGNIISLEASATQHSLKKLNQSIYVHTNHYMRIPGVEGKKEQSLQESRARYANVVGCLQKGMPPIDILRTHGIGGVCRHGEIKTGFACIFTPSQQTIEWHIGHPCGKDD